MKYIISFILLFLIAWMVFLCSDTEAQVKIGDITIPDETAGEYFLWCYQNPDTTWLYDYSELKSEIKKLEKAMLSDSSYGYCYTRIVSAKETKLSDNNIGRVYKEEPFHEWILHYIGYLTKHEPTAQDFSVWFIKRKDK